MNTKKTSGFSLIELITVIAIIIILLGIGLPIYGMAKAKAYQNEDFSELNEIRRAMNLYREDQGGFPPQMLGYATLYSNNNSVIPADKTQSYLYPRRVSSINTFNSNQNRVDNATITPAVWSNNDLSPIGSNPQQDLDGNGFLDSNDDTEHSRQLYSPFDGCVSYGFEIDYSCGSNSAMFYTSSGYDIARVPYTLDARLPQYELRYSLFWTHDGIEANADAAHDDPRQLGYNNPPDDTIITWNTWWRRWESVELYPGVNMSPTRDSRDMVLTVGGNAINVPSRAMFLRSWRNRP